MIWGLFSSFFNRGEKKIKLDTLSIIDQIEIGLTDENLARLDSNTDEEAMQYVNGYYDGAAAAIKAIEDYLKNNLEK